MDLDEYQRRSQATDQVPAKTGDGLVVPLLGLVGEVGTLGVNYKKRLRDGDSYRFYTDDLFEELGDVLWYVSNLAQKVGLSLEDIAEGNLAKTNDRWQPPVQRPERYDANFEVQEQLPSRLVIDFIQQEDEAGTFVQVMANGAQLGNDLRDNARLEDGFRFHDVLHLSHLALLGWSPVMRGFLNCKRRSDERVDEVEDGGRAKVTEEGIVAYVFSRARESRFFFNTSRVDNDILRTIRQLVGHFEVRDRTAAEWEHVILTGYGVFRSLRDNDGGLVIADVDAGTITYEGH